MCPGFKNGDKSCKIKLRIDALSSEKDNFFENNQIKIGLQDKNMIQYTKEKNYQLCTYNRYIY